MAFLRTRAGRCDLTSCRAANMPDESLPNVQHPLSSPPCTWTSQTPRTRQTEGFRPSSKDNHQIELQQVPPTLRTQHHVEQGIQVQVALFSNRSKSGNKQWNVSPFGPNDNKTNSFVFGINKASNKYKSSPARINNHFLTGPCRMIFAEYKIKAC